MLPVPSFARFKHLSLTLRGQIRFDDLKSDSRFDLLLRHLATPRVLALQTGIHPLGRVAESIRDPCRTESANVLGLCFGKLKLSEPSLSANEDTAAEHVRSSELMARAGTMILSSLSWTSRPAIIISSMG